MIEYKAHGLAVREKTARLKALRLAEGASHERFSGDRFPRSERVPKNEQSRLTSLAERPETSGVSYFAQIPDRQRRK
jgi:hypothetical protein